MARRLSDRDKQRLAEARLRELAVKRKTKAIGLNASGNRPSQLQSLVPELKEKRLTATKSWVTPRDKGLGFGKILAKSVKQGYLGIYCAPKSGVRRVPREDKCIS